MLFNLIVILITFGSATVAIAEVPGGSNYAWYAIENCARDQFGVLQRFTEARDIITRQLQEMHDGGQRRLRIPLFFDRQVEPGHMSVNRDGLPRDKLARIEAFLSTAKRIGFTEIVFGFFPQAGSAPDWKEWREDIYQENWLVVNQIRPILQRVGIKYYIDLLNEGAPFPFQAQLLAYAKRLWNDYTTTFGAADTVGFSIIAEAGRINALAEIYINFKPALFDVHVYKNPDKAIIATKEALDRVNLGGVPWIVGETFYNDDEVLGSIRRAAVKGHVKIEYILQWPVTKGAACTDVSVVPLRAPASLVAPPR